MKNSQHWTTEYFAPVYNKVYSGPLFSEPNTELEVAFLIEQLCYSDAWQNSLEPSGLPLCDVGCAFGRHLRLIRKAGIPAIGLDRFFHLLDDHPKRGRRLVCGDMRSLPFGDGVIAGHYCLFNSFGYYGHDDNTSILQEWGRTLVPGGRLVLQIPNRPVMAQITRDFTPSQMLTHDFSMTEVYEYDDENKRMLGRGMWQFEKEQHPWNFELMLYSSGEMKKKFKSAGLSIVDCFENYDGTEFRPRSSPEMIYVCEKKA